MLVMTYNDAYYMPDTIFIYFNSFNPINIYNLNILKFVFPLLCQN